MTHKQETEDLVREAYLKTFKNLDAFKGLSSFKAWVFTIAASLAKDSLKARQRWGEDWMELVKDATLKTNGCCKKSLK